MIEVDPSYDEFKPVGSRALRHRPTDALIAFDGAKVSAEMAKLERPNGQLCPIAAVITGVAFGPLRAKCDPMHSSNLDCHSMTSSARASSIGQLAAANLDSRRKPALADAIVERTLLAVAQAARRKD